MDGDRFGILKTTVNALMINIYIFGVVFVVDIYIYIAKELLSIDNDIDNLHLCYA